MGFGDGCHGMGDGWMGEWGQTRVIWVDMMGG